MTDRENAEALGQQRRMLAGREYLTRQLGLLIAGTSAAAGVPRAVVRMWAGEDLRAMSGYKSGPSDRVRPKATTSPGSEVSSPESEASSP